MIREHLFAKRAPADPLFRWRGGDISRVEGLSDGLFAVTLTLLVVSVQVPDTFYTLWLTIRDLPIFLVSFVVLMLAWRYHYLFFRRYGLEDGITLLLNGAFLFLMLFYAYPLKFQATFLWKRILGESVADMFLVPAGVDWGQEAFFQQAGMLYFFGLGVAGVFGVLALLMTRAYHFRAVLDLDTLECFLTRASIRAHAFTVAIAFISLLILWLGVQPGYAGIVYFLLLPIHLGHTYYNRYHVGLLQQQEV